MPKNIIVMMTVEWQGDVPRALSRTDTLPTALISSTCGKPNCHAVNASAEVKPTASDRTGAGEAAMARVQTYLGTGGAAFHQHAGADRINGNAGTVVASVFQPLGGFRAADNHVHMGDRGCETSHC